MVFGMGKFVDSNRAQRFPKNFALYVITMTLMLATYLFYIFSTSLPESTRQYGVFAGIVLCVIFNMHLGNELRTQQCHYVKGTSNR
jgi:hypothetical protein